MLWKTILCPTDYSGLSEAALRLAVELAHEHRARLIVLHAVETLGPENVSFGEAVSRPQPDAYRQRLWSELHQHVKISDPQVEQEFVLSEEDPVTAIVDAAGKFSCDLIVMGTHPRHGLRRWLERSVAENVISRAPCPVLVVKEPEPHREKPADAGTSLHPRQVTEHPS
jgi:universal stress protein A